LSNGERSANEHVNCIFGSLRRLLQDQRSGIIRSIAGDAGFDLGQIPSGLANGMTQRAPILSAVDVQWDKFDDDRRQRFLPRFAEALVREAKEEVVNARILKCGFKFANGGFVPVNAAGEIPA
jgi:hypothetical protein